MLPGGCPEVGGDGTSFLRLFAGLAVLAEPDLEGCRLGGGGGTKGLASVGACEGEGECAVEEEGATGCTFREGGGGGGIDSLLLAVSSVFPCGGVLLGTSGSGRSDIDSCALKLEALLGLAGVAACRRDTGGGGGTLFGVDTSSEGVVASVGGCCECVLSFSGTTGGGVVSDGSRLAGGGGSGLLRSLIDLCAVGLRMPFC